MQNILVRSLKFGLLVAALGLGLTACPTSDSTPPPPKPVDPIVAADGGTPQFQGWSPVLTGKFLFARSGSAILNQGTIDTNGKFNFKLPASYPVASGLVKASDFFGNCTINPPDADVADVYLFVQFQANPSVYQAFIYFSPTADYNTVHLNDELVQFWLFAPKAFTITGAKGCSRFDPRISLDASFKAGWNFAIEKFISLNPDGSPLEGKIKALATLPSGFRWFVNPNAVAASGLNRYSLNALNLAVLPNFPAKP